MTLLKSHPGTNGSLVLSKDHVDSEGRTWPKGTAYRPVSIGHDHDEEGDTITIQVIQIESRHYQDVLTSGFGETATFTSR